MSSTNLTLGGFTQPAVARSLIENNANIEKGLSQRFMWVFPKPTYANFETLQPVDTTFTRQLGTHIYIVYYVAIFNDLFIVQLIVLLKNTIEKEKQQYSTCLNKVQSSKRYIIPFKNN